MKSDRAPRLFTVHPWRALVAFAFILTAPLVAFGGNTVLVPAGSNDALSDAIADVGPHGTVVLADGLHTESATVTVDIPVSIVGEEGAVLEVVTVADPMDALVVSPALYVHDTHGVVIDGLTLVPQSVGVGVGVVIQDASNVTVRNNAIADFEFGVFVHHGDHAFISGNLLEDMRFGAIVINGLHVHVTGNTVQRMSNHGLWLCDTLGQCKFNEISDTVAGILLCRLAADFVWPDGSIGAAELPGNHWTVANNEIQDSVAGIALEDGAHHNLVTNNSISGSSWVDIILFGDDAGLPTTFKNIITLGSHKDTTVIDDGEDNKVLGMK